MSEADGHEQTAIRHGDRSAEVDVAMAPIILGLWKRGIATTGSCQGGWDDLGRGYIQFENAAGASRFLALMARDSERGPKTLSQRALGGMYFSGERGEPRAELLWDVSAWPVAQGGPYDDDGGAATFDFAIEIAFPPSDLPAIAERIARA